MLARIPVLVWFTGPDLRLTRLTGAVLANGQDFLGSPVESLFDQGGREAPLAAHRNALEGAGGEFAFELNGRDLEAHVEPVRSADGLVVGVVGIALDVTDRLVAETALRLSEESYRSLVEEAPYAICRATQSGQLLQVNRAMLDMLGYGPGSEEDLLLRDLSCLFEMPAAFHACREELLNDRTIQGIEARWLRKDGQQIEVRLGGRAVRNASGDVLYFDLLAENITERKELEARLGQAQKMQAIGQLAGGVAHDFNNLLTVIGGQVEFLLNDAVSDQARSRLQDVKLAADRAAALTRQLLAFSRRQVLQNKVIDLNHLIEHSRRMLARLVRENIALTFTPGRNIGFVRTDPNQMEQVLMNLVVNAQDAMPGGGSLLIETERVFVGPASKEFQEGIEPGAHVRMLVRDTGCGMDPETQARIFEPFFTTKEIGEGTGLGLATVYGVVKQCGGHIQVESRTGQGTTFKIFLPCVEEPAPAHPEPVLSHSPKGSETILVVEDDATVRQLLVTYLQGLGYRVLAAPDGVAALETVRQSADEIDLLLSDLVLPRMGGRELGKTLGRVKVIFVSGYAGHDITGEDLNIGGAHFVSKPFSMQRLAAVIRNVLDGVVPNPEV